MWNALVPIKGYGQRKTRLAPFLPEADRRILSEQMFEHVVSVLSAQPRISRVLVLSHMRPRRWDGAWLVDEGRGLNAELRAVCCELGDMPLLVIHADLPLLCADDVAAMIDAGERGCAIGPDRHELGTNALALRNPAGFDFAFGNGSLARHLAQAGELVDLVRRRGISVDIDTPQDLALITKRDVGPSSETAPPRSRGEATGLAI